MFNKKDYYKKWYLKNKLKKKKQVREYYWKNRTELLLKNREWGKKWRKENKEKISIKGKKYYQKTKKKRLKYWREHNYRRRKVDLNYAIKQRLRSRLNTERKRYTEKNKCLSDKKHGINYKKIMEHLKPFPKDISKFHIDHIKPLCSFDLTDPKQLKIACSPENHQWLLAEDNIKKGGSQ